MSSPVFIYLTNSCLGPRRLCFLNLLQGSLAWTLVCTIHGAGRCLQMWESHLKGFMEKGDHRPPETLIVVYGWVCEKQAGRLLPKPTLEAIGALLWLLGALL